MKTPPPYLRLSYHAIVLLLLTNLSNYTLGQIPLDTADFRYQKIDLYERFNVVIINAMTQDKNGFLWLGTNVGLFRYDGAAFKQYRYIPGKNGTLANELITALAVNDQFLFIGTQNGLSILKLDSDSIINFHSGKADPNSPEGFGIADLLWHKDELWILGKDFSLTSYDPNKKLFHRFVLQKPDLVTESHIAVDIRKVLADRKNANNLWISSTYGLYRFSISNHSSELINPPGRGYFNTQNVYGMSMEQTSDGILWIGGVIEKLLSYNPSSNEWKEYQYAPSNRIDSNVTSINSLHVYDSSHLLVFTGLARYQYLFDTRKKVFLPMTDKARLQGRSDLVYDGGVRFIFSDRGGNTWFGYAEGFCRLITERNPFTFYEFSFNGKPSKNNNFQQAFLEDVANKLLFIGTRNGDGLLIRDFRKDTLEIVHSSLWVDSAKYDLPIEKLFLDEKGMLWLATQKGLFTWEKGWKRFQPYENYLIKNYVSCFARSNNGIFFLGTRDSGLLALQIANHKLLPEWNNTVSFHNIRAIHLDKEQNLWIGGNEGLGLLNTSTQKFNSFNKEFFDLLPNDHLNVADILQDNQGRIWVSTSTTGVFCIEKKNQNWIAHSFNTSNGMPDNNVGRMVIDKNGHIWGGTTIGIFRIIPENFTITSFTRADGLGFANRIGGGKYALHNGYILLSANRSYEFFHPDSLMSHSSNDMMPYLYSFNAGGTDKNYFADINNGKPIILSHDGNRFEAELGFLDFTPHRKIRYEYRLDGYEKDWNRTNSRNYVVYSNLAPGKYQFEYSAIDLNKSGEQNIRRIPITIEAPWWKQWWFTTVYIAVIAALTWVVYRNFKKRKERALQQKEREAKMKEMNRQMNEMRLMAIRSQMNPHFLFNCLNSIQKMIVVEDVNGAYQYLSKFSKLLRMVLDNSEKNFIPLSSEMEMNSLYFELESLRFKKSFEYKIEIDEAIDPESIQVPSLLLQPFIENAIWHGLMHKNGDKKLWIRFSKLDNQLVCSIEDNGVGREYAAAIKSQKLGSHYFESKGSRLSEQRIELLNQQLEGKSSIEITDLKNGIEPAGTRVTIELPLQTKTNHLDKDSYS